MGEVVAEEAVEEVQWIQSIIPTLEGEVEAVVVE